jgi:site-specific recombinase XerC
MGRPSSGWKLRQKAPGRTYTVRFWIDGAESERSTGSSDPTEAAREAARIYADEVQRGRQRRVKRARGAGPNLEELVAAWTVALASTHDAGTVKTWELYALTHWLPHFGATHHLTDVMCNEYMRARLLVVQSSTVRKELSALRHFLNWCVELGALPQKVNVPSVPKRVTGTRFEKRRRSGAIALSPDETEAMLAKLEAWSTSKRVPPFPIQARFLVAYETSLRPATLDALLLDVHYRIGSSTIMLTHEFDKNRWGREVPLSSRARAALDAVCVRLHADRAKRLAELPEGSELPPEPIFGKHDYREHLKAAAESVLSPERAKLFNGAHFRSARITHWLEQTNNLPGTQYMAGHRLATTTAGYVKQSLRAALDVVSAVEQSRAPKKKTRSAVKRSG